MRKIKGNKSLKLIINYRNRNGNNKLLAENEICICGGTSNLYWREVKKLISKNYIVTRNVFQKRYHLKTNLIKTTTAKRRRNNIVMVKLDRPKKVTLPNGTTFHAKYKILKRDSLPADANIRRAFKRQRKQKEQG